MKSVSLKTYLNEHLQTKKPKPINCSAIAKSHTGKVTYTSSVTQNNPKCRC